MSNLCRVSFGPCKAALRRGTRGAPGWLMVVFLMQSDAAGAPLTPDDPGPADLRFFVDASQEGRPISPFIYGMNSYAGGSFTNPVRMDRLGGNRWTGYNWETNASNAGADWYHHSDYHLTGGQANRPPGGAIAPALSVASAADRALVVTLPMAGYVSADANGTVDESQAAPSSRWKTIVPRKQDVYPGAALATVPDTQDGYVFTDELVHWVESTRSASQQVFYSLDNEPGLWGEPLPRGWQSGDPPGGTVVAPSSGGRTHPLIHPYAPTFAELRDKTLAHAAAIKDVEPNAVVFGGVGYGWNEFTTLQDAPDKRTAPAHPDGDRTGELHYYEWLLSEVAKQEAIEGRTLMDVLDLHWYPEAQGGGVRITANDNRPEVAAARVQAPRSLWDPTYVEQSWITQWSTWQGSPGNPGPIALLPRLQRDVDDFKPGTKLAITEYNFGGTNHISGAIAQADALGIFGREGLFAAAYWDLHGAAQSQFVQAAFRMFLDYDGAGGAFGDVSVSAGTDAIAESAVYASLDPSRPHEMVLVAINRTAEAQLAGLQITHDVRFELAEVYQLTAASSTPVRAADLPLTLTNALQVTLPAYSVSTLVLRGAVPGDATGDGQVDAADLDVWERAWGTLASKSAADFDRDGDVDGGDWLIWQAAFGVGGAAAVAIPEPSTFGCVLCCGWWLAAGAFRKPAA